MNATLAKRLKHAREKSDLTQADLASRLGFKDRQTLAAIEAGERKLSADELMRVMQTLNLDLDYFTDPFRLVGEGSFNWRAHKHAELSQLDEFEDRAGRWIATYRKLNETAGKSSSPLQVSLPLTEKSSFEDAWSAAEALCNDWGLGEVPALNLGTSVRRNLRALILNVDAPRSISGAACHLPGLNSVLINRREPEGRRHFDLAHECFHLLTWEQLTPERTEQADGNHRGKGKHKRIEQLADNFAGALLMPTHVLKPRWESKGHQDIHNWLNENASALCVSARALMWRLFYLGWLSKGDLVEINETRLTANGRSGEQPTPRLFSEDFVKCFHEALSRGDLSVRRTASLLHLSIESLAALFRDYELTVPFDL